MLGLINQRKRLPDALVIGRDAFTLYQGNLFLPAGWMVLTGNLSNSTSPNDDFLGHT